jgi:hypothetical protein
MPALAAVAFVGVDDELSRNDLFAGLAGFAFRVVDEELR